MTTAVSDDSLSAQPAGPRADVPGRTLIVAAAILLLLLLLLLPVLGGRYYVMSDIGHRELAFRIYYVNHLLRGESVTWAPHIYGGYYLLGDAHIGSQHPAIPLLYRFAPLHWAFTIETLARYPLALAGAFLLLKRWGLPADTALFGAATLAFGGFYLMHFGHVPMVNVVAHLPWLLLAADVLLRDESPRRARWAWLAVVLLSGSQWLTGSTPLVYMSAQAELIYVLVLWAWGRTGRGPVMAWVLAKVLGSLVGCAQLLPTLETALLSERIDTGVDAVLLGSLHPADFLQLFSPYWFKGRSYLYDTMPVSHEMSLYCGSVATILAAWALIRCRRLGPLGVWVGAAMVFVVIGLLFALGRYGGLSVLQYYLPVVGKFRTPGRYILIAHVGLAALAAIGLADLERARSAERREPRALWLLLLVPLGQVVWLGAAFVMNGFHSPERFAWRALSMLIFLVAFLLVCASSRRVRYALPLLVFFALADEAFYAVSLYGRHVFLKHSADALAERSPLDLAIERSPIMTLQEYSGLVPPCPARAHERVIGVEGDLNLVRDAYSIQGYTSLSPRRLLDYARPAARRVAAVRWEMRGWGPEGAWHEIPGALPYVRLVARAVASEAPRRTLEEIDPETTAVVSEALDLPQGDVGTAELEAEHPGHLKIVSEAPAKQLLVVSESYHPGWWAAVDGRWQRPIRVNGDFLGLVVPEGRHRVEFAFRPWSLRLGPSVSWAALALALVLFGGLFVSRRQRHGAISDLGRGA